MTVASFDQPRVLIRRESLVLGLLALTMLVSFMVSIEPAPYEGCMLLLAVALLISGAKLDAILLPLLGLIALWAAAGSFAVLQVAFDHTAVIYLAITIYLALNTVIFACLLGENTQRRLQVLLNWYVVAATISAGLGTLAYFGVLPGADMFLLNGRASGGFKDPNVFGPFLILPLLHLIQVFIYKGFRPLAMAALVIILMGLFFSYSRGAWGHFVASSLVMLGLMFVTSPTAAFRLRLITLSVVAVFGVAVLLVVLLSIPSIQNMFAERANLVNYYDTGEYGRFGSQAAGFRRIFEFPVGLGPKQFSMMFGMDPHNVYLASLYAYGWIGALAYYGFVISTVIVGLRGVFVRAPWQPALIAFLGTFVGVAAEGYIIDTDHWRHFFLLAGGIWGLTIASLRKRGSAVAAHAT
jgi:hypothetical protein